MSDICGDINRDLNFAREQGLGRCVRPSGHPFVHRDVFSQTWSTITGAALGQDMNEPEPEGVCIRCGATREGHHNLNHRFGETESSDSHLTSAVISMMDEDCSRCGVPRRLHVIEPKPNGVCHTWLDDEDTTLAKIEEEERHDYSRQTGGHELDMPTCHEEHPGEGVFCSRATGHRGRHHYAEVNLGLEEGQSAVVSFEPHYCYAYKNGWLCGEPYAHSGDHAFVRKCCPSVYGGDSAVTCHKSTGHTGFHTDNRRSWSDAPSLASPQDVGLCGEVADLFVSELPGDRRMTRRVCFLMQGHQGSHRSRDGRSWDHLGVPLGSSNEAEDPHVAMPWREQCPAEMQRYIPVHNQREYACCVRNEGHRGAHRSVKGERWSDHMLSRQERPKDYSRNQVRGEAPPNPPGAPPVGADSTPDPVLTRLAGDVIPWVEIAHYLFGLLDDIDTAGDWAKDDLQAYRAMASVIAKARSNVCEVTDGVGVTGMRWTRDVPTPMPFEHRVSAYVAAQGDDREVYSMAGAQRLISELRAGLEISEGQTRNEAERGDRLAAENIALRKDLQKAREQGSRMASMVGDDAVDPKQHEDLSLRFENQRVTIQDQRRQVNEANARADKLKEQVTKLEGDLNTVIHQRNDKDLEIRRLQRELKRVIESTEFDRHTAQALRDRVASADIIMTKQQTNIADHVALNAEQMERIDQLTRRMRMLLCVQHAGASLPRCAKCLWDSMKVSQDRLSEEEHALKERRDATIAIIERLSTSTEALTLQVARVLADAGPLLDEYRKELKS